MNTEALLVHLHESEMLEKQDNDNIKILKFYSGNDFRHLKDWSRMIKTFPNIDTCLLAVKKCGVALQYVPEALKTPELCLIALQQNSKAFRYVPKELRKKPR